MLAATYLVVENAGVFPGYVVAMTIIRKAHVHVGTFGGGGGAEEGMAALAGVALAFMCIREVKLRHHTRSDV